MTQGASPWDLAAIAESDKSRAEMLSAAPPANLLASLILASFEEGLRTNRLRVGMDEWSRNREDLRLTLQFHVGETLSDQFFNAATGYRAQFRFDWQRGLDYNNHIIARIRSSLATLMPEALPGRRLDHRFEDLGPITVTREQACASLVPTLSKVWFCGRLILGNGEIEELPAGLTGPRLRLSDGTSWAAIWRDEACAWLDVKGAFLGSDGPYQLKDPVARAKKLAAAGEA